MRISSPGRMGLAATRRSVRSSRFDSTWALGVDEWLQREASPIRRCNGLIYNQIRTLPTPPDTSVFRAC